MSLCCFWLGHSLQILGHTDRPGQECCIRLHARCSRCGEYQHSDHRIDDPFVDEDSPWRSRHTVWSGYSWWLRRPLEREPSTVSRLVER
jgi:hypothetical protein